MRQRPMRSLLRRNTWESIVGIYRYLTVYCRYLQVPDSLLRVFTGTWQCIVGIYRYQVVYSGYLRLWIPGSVFWVFNSTCECCVRICGYLGTHMVTVGARCQVTSGLSLELALYQYRIWLLLCSLKIVTSIIQLDSHSNKIHKNRQFHKNHLTSYRHPVSQNCHFLTMLSKTIMV